MTTLNQQIIYDKIKQNYSNEIEEVLDRINQLMETELDDDGINRLAHYFIILSNLNNAKTLVRNIKPTKNKKNDS